MAVVKKFTFNAIAENTYIVYDETKQCVIIDPGCNNDAERNILQSFIEQEELSPVMLLNTHCHVDHIPGNAFVAEKYNTPIYIHELELQIMNDAPLYGRMFGVNCPPSPEPTGYLKAGENEQFGNTTFKILFTPGHSPGSVTFYCEEDAFVVAGDVLFLGSVGRYDLPGANGDTLFNSIDTQLMTLPDNTKVYCGHGPDTSIGHERKTNTFLNKAFRSELS
jgi:hydroxyacylglutathione hydrolase